MVIDSPLFVRKTNFLQPIHPTDGDFSAVARIHFLFMNGKLTAVLRFPPRRRDGLPTDEHASINGGARHFVRTLAWSVLSDTFTREPALNRTGIPLYLRTKMLPRIAHSPEKTGCLKFLARFKAFAASCCQSL